MCHDAWLVEDRKETTTFASAVSPVSPEKLREKATPIVWGEPTRPGPEVSEVGEQMERNDEVIEGLVRVAGELYERLVPIMGPATPARPAVLIKSTEGLAPITQRMIEQNVKVREAKELIEGILERLAV